MLEVQEERRVSEHLTHESDATRQTCLDVFRVWVARSLPVNRDVRPEI